MLLRFLHGGDFHLDSPFHSLTPKQAARARGEQRSLLDRFCRIAKEEGIDLVFLTGDLFDSSRIYPETLKALREALEEIEVDVFLSPGNHDPYTDASPYTRLPWPPHVHIFKSEQIERIELPHLGCTVYGSAFTSSHRTTPPLEGLQASGDGLHFGCFHGEVTQGLSRYGPISPGQIAASGLHYLALGHVHSASGLTRTGDSYYAYPGCPQGRGFDETGEKGVFLGTTDGRNLGLSFLPICSRQYQLLCVDITSQDPEEALRRQLPSSPRPDIVRLILTGQREDEENLSLPRLHKLASGSFYSVSIQDQTTLGRDVWARQTEETLTGLFLREIHRRIEAAAPENRPELELAARFGLAALEGREAPE